MAGNIKGITIEFRGETTQLDKALRTVKNDAKSVDNQLRETNRLLKFNPRNAELLKQKFDLLKQKVNQTENELKQFRAIEAQLKAQKVSKQSAEWMKVRRQIIEAESKLKHFNAELLKMRYANVTKVGNAFKSAGQNMRSAGMYATMGAAAGVMAGKKLLEMNSAQQQVETKLAATYKNHMGAAEGAAEATKELASELQKTGVIGDEVTLSGAKTLATYAKYPETVDKLLPAMDDWLAAEKGANATQEDAEAKAKLLGKALNGQTGALTRLGIALTDEQKEILKTGNEEEKAALITELLDGKFGDMNKTLAETDEGKLSQLKNTLGDIGERLGAVLLPALSQFATWISENVMPKVEQLMGFLEAHPAFAKLAVAITTILAVGGPLLIFLGAIFSAVGTLITAFSGFMTLIGGLGGALTLFTGPVGLVIAIIGALIAIGVLLYKNWDKIKAKLTALKKWMVTTWNNIKTSVANIINGLKTKIATTWDNIKTKIKTVIDNIKTAISDGFHHAKQKATDWMQKLKEGVAEKIQAAKDKVKEIIDKIKGLFPISIGKLFKGLTLPHFSLDWSSKDFGKLGSIKYPTGINVSWYAQGGIFDSPTIAGIGEAGPEAVVPLNKLWDKMDAIAAASGAAPIVVNVYGSDNMSVNELALAVEQRIIQMQKRRTQAWR